MDEIKVDAVGVRREFSRFGQASAVEVDLPHVAMTVHEQIDVLGSPQIP